MHQRLSPLPGAAQRHGQVGRGSLVAPLAFGVPPGFWLRHRVIWVPISTNRLRLRGIVYIWETRKLPNWFSTSATMALFDPSVVVLSIYLSAWGNMFSAPRIAEVVLHRVRCPCCQEQRSDTG